MKLNYSVSHKIVEQLSWLSNWMNSEFDLDSDRVYYKHIDYINDEIEQFQEYHKGNTIYPNMYIDRWLVDMDNDLFKIRNNVLIPENLKHDILGYYTMRCVNMMRISDQKLKEYFNLLNKKRLDCEDEHVSDLCWNEINDAYYEEGIGWSTVELKVQYFNTLIQEYLFQLE